jgi:hypothetical protein
MVEFPAMTLRIAFYVIATRIPGAVLTMTRLLMPLNSATAATGD